MERFEEVVAIIRRDFPHLAITVNRNHPEVHAIVELPAQEGLDFPVTINLQNCDELHLNVSKFWVEWFPCCKQEVFEEFVEAVRGILSGKFRVLESYLFGIPVAARLQQPTGPDTWKTLAIWGNLWMVVPWPRKQRIVQNRPSI